MKRLSIAAAAALSLLALASCSKSKPAGDVVKIGVFEPMTGANAAGGAMEVEGIKLANALYPTVKVGDRELKIELVISDNKSDKVEAANAAQRLVDRTGRSSRRPRPLGAGRCRDAGAVVRRRG